MLYLVTIITSLTRFYWFHFITQRYLTNFCKGYEHQLGRDIPYLPWWVLGPTQPPVKWVPVIKRPVRGVHYPPTSSAEVIQRVELYLYSPSGPSCPVIGHTLPPSHFLLLRAFAKLRRATFGLVIYVLLSIRPMEQLCSHGTHFNVIWYVFKKNISKNLSFIKAWQE
jgi:hypothetical protein